MAVSQIMLALSGGVDSAMAGHKLISQGYHVTGVFMRNWHDDNLNGQCPWSADLSSAQQAAEQLGIELQVADFSAIYKKEVFDPFLKKLAGGLTPSPDLLCNKYIKFNALLAYAKEQGFSQLATGHYADIEPFDGFMCLKRAKDSRKDQSYFLAMLNHLQLNDVIFPLAKSQKHEVKAQAEDLGFKQANRPESMGICFIGNDAFAPFIRQYLHQPSGLIIDESGSQLGKHQGLACYTIGQRKGLGIGGKQGTKQAPWYVLDKQLDTNQLVVTQDRDRLKRRHVALTDMHVVHPSMMQILLEGKNQVTISAKIRHQQEPLACRLIHEHGQYRLYFLQELEAVANGQMAVLYHDQWCFACAEICGSG